MPQRQIVHIDEEKCDGCGQCILACAEGALAIIDGKAKLAGDIYCDGLGACLGDCPQNAISIITREGEDFDEEAVHQRLEELKDKNSAKKNLEPIMGCGCPSTEAMTFARPEGQPSASRDARSALSHFPVKLRLVPPDAVFLRGTDLLLLADCAAVAYAALHQDMLPGRAVAMACPKFDDAAAHTEKLAEVMQKAGPKSVSVVYMDVPCCKGLLAIAGEAAKKAGYTGGLRAIQIGRDGLILQENALQPAA